MAGTGTGTFTSTVPVQNDPVQPQVPGAGSPARGNGRLILQLIGLWFLVGAAYGLYVMISYSVHGPWLVYSVVGITLGSYAAVRILQFDERGRTVGLILSGLALVRCAFLLLGAAAGQVSIPALALPLMAASAFIFWALLTSKDFKRR